jgi:hypothetical protein
MLVNGQEADDKRPLSPLAVNEFEISCSGGIWMEDGGVSRVNNQGNIGQLLDGQHHFDDVNYNAISYLVNYHVQTGCPQPKDLMLTHVEENTQMFDKTVGSFKNSC